MSPADLALDGDLDFYDGHGRAAGRTQAHVGSPGGQQLPREDPRVHFGLGEAATVSELQVRYPGGRETRLTDVPVDRIVTVASP